MKNSKVRTDCNESGRLLIEVVCVSVIIALLLVAGVVNYSKMIETAKMLLEKW